MKQNHQFIQIGTTMTNLKILPFSFIAVHLPGPSIVKKITYNYCGFVSLFIFILIKIEVFIYLNYLDFQITIIILLFKKHLTKNNTLSFLNFQKFLNRIDNLKNNLSNLSKIHIISTIEQLSRGNILQQHIWIRRKVYNIFLGSFYFIELADFVRVAPFSQVI